MSIRARTGAERAAHGTVLRSVTAPDGTHCIDLFRRTDGSCGFEVYRRDSEDTRGWFAVGAFASIVYPTAEAAWQAARTWVQWLSESDATPA
jgi:hypothetical protein